MHQTYIQRQKTTNTPSSVNPSLPLTTHSPSPPHGSSTTSPHKILIPVFGAICVSPLTLSYFRLGLLVIVWITSVISCICFSLCSFMLIMCFLFLIHSFSILGGFYSIMPLQAIVVIALAWHSLGREIESHPRVRESFLLNTLWRGYCHYGGIVMGGWGNLADVRVNTQRGVSTEAYVPYYGEL